MNGPKAAINSVSHSMIGGFAAPTARSKRLSRAEFYFGTSQARCCGLATWWVPRAPCAADVGTILSAARPSIAPETPCSCEKRFGLQ
jgi:hypothetical protein